MEVEGKQNHKRQRGMEKEFVIDRKETCPPKFICFQLKFSLTLLMSDPGH